MKKTLYSRLLVFTFLFLVSSVWAWGQTTISFDISKGDVRLTDETYSGKDSNGATLSGAHNSGNHYVISGTTTSYNVQVGTSDKMVTTNFIIYLNGVDIRRSKEKECVFSVYNQGSSVVAVILQNNSKNILYSGLFRAGLEKSGGASSDGTLLITCEAGYTAWLSNHTHGHTTGVYNESACDGTCGHLDAKSGNAWQTLSGSTYYRAGAGIGTAGYGDNGSTTAGKISGNNALVNLTIAGGHIEAAGTWGNTGGSSGGGASIGTGSAKMSDQIGGTVNGLKITGGDIKAYRIDNSAACIGGGYRSGYVNMDIYGGTIDATGILTKNSEQYPDLMRAAAIGGGGGGSSSSSPAGATVHIHNGKINALGQYGSAIGSGAGGANGYGQNAVVIIDNGHITATTNKGEGNGSGAAIGSGGSIGVGHAGNATVTINGGKIEATSELGADIGGGGTNSTNSGGYGGKGFVNISGGTITANTGGIGGGRANAGIGGNSEITISGAEITAKSIGGGRSAKQSGGNVKLTVSDGKLTVADFIGGGIGGVNNDLIGWAKVYISGGDISGRTIMRASTSEGCVFDMTGGKLTSPIKDQPGGAVYMIDPNGQATMSGGTIFGCEGTTGGAFYMSGGTFTISDNAIMKDNHATNGGAVYLDGTGEFKVEGGTIQTNEVSANGGAFYLNNGTFSMSGGKVSNNKSTGGNGAGIYIASGTVTVSGGEVSSNIATIGKGGGFYVNGGTVTLSNGTIASNKAATVGGGICLEGSSIAVNGCTLTGNEATAGNGGGIFLSNGKMTYNGGKLTYNKAIGTTENINTAYHSTATGIKGVGGGIYISNQSTLTFGDLNNLGIYANSATMAADDLCADGNGTTLVVPNISAMSLQDYAANAASLGWYEDYFVEDVSYNKDDVARDKSKSTFTNRYRQALEGGLLDELREYQFDGESVTLKDIYVAFALGFRFSDLIIRVWGLEAGESCVFSVIGNGNGGKYKYQVPVHGSNAEYDQQRIVRVPVDVYTVKLLEVWPWAYDPTNPANRTITRLNSEEEGIYKFTVKHKETSIAHDEDYVKKQLE